MKGLIILYCRRLHHFISTLIMFTDVLILGKFLISWNNNDQYVSCHLYVKDAMWEIQSLTPTSDGEYIGNIRGVAPSPEDIVGKES